MRLRWLAVLALTAVTVALIAAYDRAALHFLGWDGQASDNYAAWSGSVPALFTLVGLSTIISGIWHNLNCHQPGCLRMGKHKVSGTPWCSKHHENARPQRSAEELLESIEAALNRVAADSKTANDTAAELNRRILGELTAMGTRDGGMP